MNIDFNYKILSNFNVESIEQKIFSLKKSDWEIYNYRQKNNTVHKYTKTIPILYDEEYSIYRGKESKFYKLFKEDIDSLEYLLSKVYEEKGEIIRAVLVNLPAGNYVKRHYDRSRETFKIHPRVHIPIITNPDVSFIIEDENFFMKQGTLYEINNNNKLHGVYNNSTQDRIHLILDWKAHNITGLL